MKHSCAERDLLQEVEAALAKTQARLLAERCAEGHWVGELSSSALSTATAVTALSIFARETHLSDEPLIQLGLQWLARHQNDDGGWGDTVRSKSNISTTALCWAAFGAVRGADEKYRPHVARAEEWLSRVAGGIAVAQLAPAIIQRYGKDRTFSVPILTMCALAGRLGSGPRAWEPVIPLPFEIAACPRKWFAPLRMPVVSYALPALIAIGQARHFHAPPRNPLSRFARNLARERTLRVLAQIQPASGGFLEATPLTSFVAMSLAGSGKADHIVCRNGIEFLRKSVRPDGSWPIDTNLSTWTTTLSMNALEHSSYTEQTPRLLDWLLGQQYRELHPYTGAAPGGWAWTDLSGGVPDADDTSGALLALHAATPDSNTPPEVVQAVLAGSEWLLGLQNTDGGIPTFCKGWGHLPFDMSSPDITAHTVRAWSAWMDRAVYTGRLKARIERAQRRALDYLLRVQRPEGDWIPLWFGNEHDTEDENHVYGTAKVLAALLPFRDRPRFAAAIDRAISRLLHFQQDNGGWSGAAGGKVCTEETALAVETLAHCLNGEEARRDRVWDAFRRGVHWLVQFVERGEWDPTPIGFYFARLWYYERLYPVIFTAGALRAAARLLAKYPSNPLGPIGQ